MHIYTRKSCNPTSPFVSNLHRTRLSTEKLNPFESPLNHKFTYIDNLARLARPDLRAAPTKKSSIEGHPGTDRASTISIVCVGCCRVRRAILSATAGCDNALRAADSHPSLPRPQAAHRLGATPRRCTPHHQARPSRCQMGHGPKFANPPGEHSRRVLPRRFGGLARTDPRQLRHRPHTPQGKVVGARGEARPRKPPPPFQRGPAPQSMVGGWVAGAASSSPLVCSRR